jgi:hypothetical protein
MGKDISVRPPGKERFVRLCRNFGDDYDIEAIRRRILAQKHPERIIIPAEPPPKKVRPIGTFHKAKRMTGYRAQYFYYLYRMGVLPKKRKPSPKKVYFLFREDIRHIQNISRETRLLVKHGIDTADQLAAYKTELTDQINTLYNQRKHLRYQARSIKDEDRLAAVKSEIAALSVAIGELRREVGLCEDIETRSGVIKDKLRQAREAELAEKSKSKEVRTDEPFRRRR